MRFRKKVIKIEEDTPSDIYASFEKKDEIEKDNPHKDNYLETHTVPTKGSRVSKLILYGFYALILLVGVIVFFMIRADRYAFYVVKDEININSGSTYQVELTPKYIRYFDYLNYKYEIEDERIAKVDEFGTITAVGSGTTTLKISLRPGFSSKKVRIISNASNTQNISLLVYKNNKLQSGNTMTLEVNQTITLKAIADNNDKSFIDVTYSSNNESVATVDDFGNVTAKAKGEAVIKGTKDGITAELTITVKEKEIPTIPNTSNSITKVDIGTNQITKYVGDEIKLSPTTTPKNIKANKIIWTTSNSKVASISSDGTIKALKKGTAVITVDVDGVKDTCTVIVKEKENTTPTPTPTPTVPTGTQVSASEVTLSKTSLSIDKGKTATFDIKVKGVVGLISVSSSDSSVAKVSVSNSDCNGLECFFDAQEGKESSITYTVTGVKEGTAYINVSLSDLVSYNEKTITGTGKIGVLVK